MQLANINVGNGQPLFVIAGPCVIESESMIINTARTLKKVGEELGIGLIFKSLFDKANGSYIDSYRGLAFFCLFVATKAVEHKSDGPNSWPLALGRQWLGQLRAIDTTVKASPRLEDLLN